MFNILKKSFVSPNPETSPEQLREQVIEAIRTVYDQGFDFSNPNVKDGCGCGESFAV